MRKFRNRRRLLAALTCGMLVLGVSWLPAQAGNGGSKKCDEASERGNENSRKNCPPPSTTTSSSSTTTSSTTTSTSTTTTTTTAPPTLQDTLNQTVDETLETVVPAVASYPDLVPDVRETYVNFAFAWDETSQSYVPYPVLHFDTWAQNFGAVALDLMTDDVTNLEDPPVSQCVAWRGRICQERQPVGGFLVHPTHGHIHFEDFAAYELRSLLSDGTPDFSAAGLLATSDKVSFCLVDSQQVRDDADPVGTYAACNATREGISAGWSDVYGSQLEGQNMSIDGLADGRYAVIVKMNPEQRIFESSYANNLLAVTVELDSTGEWPEARIVSRSFF